MGRWIALALFLISISLVSAFSSQLTQPAVIVPGANSAPAGVQDYLEASVSELVQPNGNISINGMVLNATDGTAFLPGSELLNATLASSGASATAVTSATGAFSFNLTAPSSASSSNSFLPYLVYVTTNDSVLLNKTYSVYVTAANNVTLKPVESLPPYPTGATFLLNLSYFNGTSPNVGGSPLVQIFQEGGGVQSWTVTALGSGVSDAFGNIQYNVTVPTGAQGQYLIQVDNGVASQEFEIAGLFEPVVATETATGGLTSLFSPNSAVNVTGFIRYRNDTGYDLQGSDSATASITLPNQSVVTMPLNVFTHSSVVSGVFSQTSQPGAYGLTLTATISGKQYQDTSQFSVESLQPVIQIPSNALKDNDLAPGKVVTFLIDLVNQSDGSLLVGNSTGATAGSPNAFRCDATNLTFLGFFDSVTGNNVTDYSFMTPVFGTQAVQSTSTCSLQVAVPNVPGTYQLFVNVTSPDQLQVLGASTDIPVQGVQLGASGVDSAGNSVYYLQAGANATFEITAVNITNGNVLDGSAIQNVSVLRVESSDAANGVSSSVYDNFSLSNASNCSTCGQNPATAIPFWVNTVLTDGGVNHTRVTLSLPLTGGGKITFNANVSGKILNAEADYIPQSDSAYAYAVPLQNGVPTYQVDCSQPGKYSFGMYGYSINTGLPVQGLEIQGISGAQDSSGNPIADASGNPIAFLQYKNSTDSTGFAVFNITTTQAIPDGAYSILFNSAYNGQTMGMPGWIFCKSVALDFSLSSSISPAQIRTDDGFTAAYSNILAQPAKGAPSVSVQNGTIALVKMVALMQDYSYVDMVPASGQVPTGNITAGAASITVNPANFSVATFPNALSFTLVLNVTNGSAVGVGDGQSYIVGGMLNGNLDVSAGSFSVVPYSVVFHPDSGTVPSSMSLGQSVSVIINASTNVSASGANFSVAFNQPNGQTVNAPVTQTALLVNGWNSSANKGVFNEWNVTFSVPTSLTSGPQSLTFTVNNTQSVQVQAFAGTVVQSLGVTTLVQNDLRMDGSYCTVSSGFGNLTNCTNSAGGLFNYSNSQMNLSKVNTLLHVSSQSGLACIKTAFNFTDGITSAADVVDSNSVLVILDNLTSGVYDTLVMNTSNGTLSQIQIANASADARKIVGNTTAAYSGFYLANLFGCTRGTVVNASITPQPSSSEPDLGQFQTNGVWFYPYLVSLANPLSANITVKSVAQKDDFGNLVSFLPSSSFAAGSSVSNANGVAFVPVNITTGGRYSLLWDSNATVGGNFLSATASTNIDSSLVGGGVGGRVDLLSFRACNLNNAISQNTDISSAGNDNLTSACSVFDLSDNRIANASIVVNLRTYAMDGSGNTLVVPATLFDGSGNVLTSANSSNSGDVQLNFTYPSGWPCNNFVNIESNVTNGSVSQISSLGGAYFAC